MRRFSLRKGVLLVLALFSSATAASSFVTVQLPQEISFQMPRNWVVLSGNKTITLDAFLESVIPNVISDIKFQANLKNDKAQPIAQVQVYYWSSEYGQFDIKYFSDADVATYDQNMRVNLTNELTIFGGEITTWLGSSKMNINRLNVLKSEYSRPSKLISGHFRVQVLRVYCEENTFSFVVSYHEEELVPLRPIIDKIISTLRCNHC